MRRATPVEEWKFSWNKRPTFIARSFAEKFPHMSQKYLEPFVNVDGEDHLTAELNKDKQRELRLKST